MNMTPGQIRWKLHSYGLAELGEYLQIRLDQLDYMVRKCHDQQQTIKELEALLPADVRAARDAERNAETEAGRFTGVGFKRED